MSNDTSSSGHGPQRQATKEKFWRRTLRDLVASGQSVRAFCAQRGLSEPSLYSWRRTLARRDAMRPKAAGGAMAAPAFVPIRLVETSAPPLEIVLAGGHCIRLRPPVDREALIQIVAALQSARVAPEPAEA